MADELSVELIIDDTKATVKLDNFQQKMKLVSDDITRVGGDKTFAGKMTIDLEKLSRQADETYKKFKEVANVRLDNGQIGNLTKEILSAQNRSRQLATDIINIRKELANPNRKSSIAFLTDELRAAEKEADVLNRKLSTVQSAGNGEADAKTHGRIQGYGMLIRHATGGYVDETQLNVGIQAAEGLGISTAALASVAVVAGSVAVAGAAVYDVTKRIRDEAERRLKVEENIASVQNRQILASQEISKAQSEFLAKAAENRQFNRALQTDDVDSLKRQRDDLIARQKTISQTKGVIGEDKKTVTFVANTDYTDITQQVNAINAQIDQINVNKINQSNDAFHKNFENYSKSADQAVEAAKKHLVLLEKQKEKFIDLRETLASGVSKEFDNPLVKMMADFDSITEKARKEFGMFGDEVVKKIAAIEKANLTKAIGVQIFENNFQALKYSQNARQLQAMPETQFASFQRAVDKFSMSVDFISKDSSLSRNITENGYYLNNYNPNNPKSFNEYNKRFFNDDTSDIGLQIRHAIEDVGKIKSLDLDGTGALGKGIAADRILSLIPSLDELVKRLSSPYTRDDARQLLAVRQQALFDSREAQRQKFEDSLQQAKNQEFGKKFAYEQIDLINKNSALTDAEKAQRRLSVTDALGNDLDSGLQQQRIKDFVSAANGKKTQEAEAFKFVKEIHGYLKKWADAKNGLPVDIGNQAVVNVNVNSSGGAKTSKLPKLPSPSDTFKSTLGDGTFEGGTFYDEYGNR